MNGMEIRGSYVLCDVDNTISDARWREPLIRHEDPDRVRRYHEFHLQSVRDRMVNRHLVTGWNCPLVMFTSMPVAYAGRRLWWLAANSVPYTHAYFRVNEDARGAVAVKRDMLLSLQKSLGARPEACIAAYDDREDVIRMYQQEFGIPAVLVTLEGESKPLPIPTHCTPAVVN